MKPLCIDLYCGLGGWAEGFLSEGWDCIGFDIERHDYGTGGYPGQLVLRDVMTIHGSELKTANVLVASPPCQKYSYMAMPWKRAKALAAWYRESPERIAELNALFDACFRIQREASEAAGRYIPLIVENVRGAQPWVGCAKWNFGSYYLWGDVPALMPIARAKKNEGYVGSWFAHNHNTNTGGRGNPVDGTGHPLGSWFKVADSKDRGAKTPLGNCSSVLWKDRQIARYAHPTSREYERHGFSDGRKAGKDWFGGYGGGFGWDCSPMRRHNSRSSARKAASAQIAKIPFPLAQHIARVFKPEAKAA